MATQSLGKYQLGQLLGQGGMGAVYRSFHPQLNRPVALKVILSASAADSQARQRFMREAQIVAGLSHPNIVRIFDVDVQDGQPYIVMDYVEGSSLAEQIASGPLALDATLQIMIPLVEALSYAHKEGVVHRDLKPANVLLRRDGSPVLADFGIARPLQVDPAAQITASGMLLGTIAYMAPEQFSGGAVDARSDIYALGVLLFETLSGRRPFTGDTGQIMFGHLQQPPPALRSIVPTLITEVELLVQRMLAKNPAERPQSAAEVAAALRALQGAGAATGATIVLQQPTIASAALPAPPPVMAIPARKGSPLVHALPVMLGVLALIVIGAAASALLVWRAATAPASSAGILLPTITIPTITIPTSAIPTTTIPTIAIATVGVAGPQPTSAALDSSQAVLRQVAQASMNDAQQVGPEQFSAGNVGYGKVGDSIWFFGEVRNDGQEAREQVKVRVTLLDKSNKELASNTGFAEMSYLNAQEIAPFVVLFSDKGALISQMASFSIEVRSDKADFQLGYTSRDISILAEPVVEQGLFGWKLNGRMRNDGAAPVKFANVRAVFYDEAGRVVGTAQDFAETSTQDDTLPAGAEGRFEVQAITFIGEPASFRLFTEGSRP